MPLIFGGSAKTNSTRTTDTGGNSDYQEYLRKMQEQQAAARAQQDAYNRERFNAYAEQQRKEAELKYQADQRQRQSVGWQAQNMAFKDVNIGSWWDKYMNWYNTKSPTAVVNREYQELAGSQPSSNQDYAARYNSGYSFTPTGQQYTYGNPAYQSGTEQYGVNGVPGKTFTYGQPMDRDNFDYLSDRNAMRLLDIIARYESKNQSYATNTSLSDSSVVSQALDEARAQDLYDKKNAKRGGGLPYNPGVTMPTPWGSDVPTTPQDQGGYNNNYNQYPGYQFPSFGGGGGYSQKDNSVNRWYENMVQWNINRPKNG